MIEQWLGPVLGLDWLRRRALKRAVDGSLRDYLATPFPSPRQDCRDTEFVALDLETSGVDGERDDILSVGLVVLRGPRLELASHRHWLVRPRTQLREESVVVHGLTDDAVACGLPLAVVLPQVLATLAGRVLVAHHAPFERAFLDHACRSVYGGPFIAPMVDTQRLEQRRRERRNLPLRREELRLGAVREAYGLPRHRAHDALADAIAAGEVWLAQWATLAGNGQLPLHSVLSRP